MFLKALNPTLTLKFRLFLCNPVGIQPYFCCALFRELFFKAYVFDILHAKKFCLKCKAQPIFSGCRSIIFASVLQRTYIQELNWQKVTRKHEKFAAKKETHITLDFMCGI